MGLTPKRVQRVLDQWDEITAPAQESAFTIHMLLFAVGTILCLVFGAWWIALMCAVVTFVFFRLAWERPGSRVRLVCDAITKRK